MMCPVAPSPSFSVAAAYTFMTNTQQTKITFHCIATSSALTDGVTVEAESTCRSLTQLVLSLKESFFKVIICEMEKKSFLMIYLDKIVIAGPQSAHVKTQLFDDPLLMRNKMKVLISM